VVAAAANGGAVWIGVTRGWCRVVRGGAVVGVLPLTTTMGTTTGTREDKAA